ncbi:MAG TPA: zinc-ribbon domain-containing protein, partial [Polyangiaceae bacterium]
MNVSCTSCSAKYAVPDEKVRGKKVKITCKHCGTGIIVDGTKLDAAAAPAGPAAAAVASPAAVAAPAAAPPVAKVEPPPEPQFDIAYPDERQETLSLTQVVDKYAAGGMDEDAF